MNNKARNTIGIIAGLLIIAIGGWALFNQGVNVGKAHADPGPASTSECSPIKPDSHANYDVLSNRVTDDGYQIHDHFEDLEAAKGSAQDLAFRAFQAGLWADAHNWQELANGDCLSAKGVEVYNAFRDRLLGTADDVASSSIDDNATAPVNLVNSGYGLNGPLIGGVLTGDLSAIHYVITMKSGYVYDLWVLKRCGNPLFEKPPPGFAPVPNVPRTSVVPPPTQVCEHCSPPIQVCTCENGCIPFNQCVPPTQVCTCDNGCIPANQCVPPTTVCTCENGCIPADQCAPPTTNITPSPKTTDNAPPLPNGGGPKDQPGPGPSNIPTTPPPTFTNTPLPLPPVEPGPTAPSIEPTPTHAPPPSAGVIPPAGTPGSTNGVVTETVTAPASYHIGTSQSQFALAA